MSSNKEIANLTAKLLRLWAQKIEQEPEMLNNITITFAMPKETALRSAMSPIESSPLKSHESSSQEANRSINLDILEIYNTMGKAALSDKLRDLDLDALRNLLKQGGFDRRGNARKWTNKEKLIELIVAEVTNRMDKGKVFSTVNSATLEDNFITEVPEAGHEPRGDNITANANNNQAKSPTSP